MPDLSDASSRNLETCHQSIIEICRTVIRDYDFTVLYGHRGEELQNGLYAQGRTAPGQIVTYCQWPDSKHNSIPSLAVDLAPYPIDWSDLYRFHELAGRMLQVAALFDVDMTWGGHWSKPDMPHFQVRIRPI